MRGTRIFTPGTSRPEADVLVRTVSSWKDVTTAPHPFDAVEFRLAGKEFGHFHRYGVLDVPFTKKIRDVLIAEGLAGIHPFVPDSGWISFRLSAGADLDRAQWLLRLSYLYRSIQHGDAGLTLEEAGQWMDEMDMSDGLRTLFASAFSRKGKPASPPVPARVSTN